MSEAQIKIESIRIATQVTEAHWQKKVYTENATRAADQRPALIKLGKSSWNEAVEWARFTCAENSRGVFKKFLRILMTEKNRATLQCDELTLESNRELGRVVKLKVSVAEASWKLKTVERSAKKLDTDVQAAESVVTNAEPLA